MERKTSSPDEHEKSTMKWWKRCCCWPMDESDNSLLIQHNKEPETFSIPRRHSSFHSTTYRTVTTAHAPCPSRSRSSSDEDEDTVSRARSWSTILPTPTQDHQKGPRRSSFSNVIPQCTKRPTLTEIAETPFDETDKGDSSDVHGFLTFVTSYDEEELRLSVFVEKADKLPKKSPQETYNTFVKTSIIVSSKNSLMTRMVKNTLSPVYKEDHVFHTNKSKWAATNQTCLKLTVFDCDRQGRHDAIGHALLPLTRLSCRREKHILPLTPMSVPTKSLGQILVGFSYVPTQSLLTVQVLKARHLNLDPDFHRRQLTKDMLDTFAKVTLMCAGQKVKSNTSRMVHGANDPFYNFKNSFVLPPQFMLDASIVVSVVVRGVLGRKFTLGRVIAGPYTELSAGTFTQWGEMVLENRNVVQWRNLYL